MSAAARDALIDAIERSDLDGELRRRLVGLCDLLAVGQDPQWNAVEANQAAGWRIAVACYGELLAAVDVPR